MARSASGHVRTCGARLWIRVPALLAFAHAGILGAH
jgi:hypothetical protein